MNAIPKFRKEGTGRDRGIESSQQTTVLICSRILWLSNSFIVVLTVESSAVTNISVRFKVIC